MNKPATVYQPPVTTFPRLPDLIDRLFSESFVVPAAFSDFWGGKAIPTLPVNLYELNDAYVFEVALPGINLANLEIQVVGRQITFKGVFAATAPENAKWIWHGLPSGEFYETLALPFEVEREKVEAKYENGILGITLPKVEYAKPKSIPVVTTK